ncbi:hypothetical protein CEXT_111921, partial [Caerostris extrusa]
ALGLLDYQLLRLRAAPHDEAVGDGLTQLPAAGLTVGDGGVPGQRKAGTHSGRRRGMRQQVALPGTCGWSASTGKP